LSSQLATFSLRWLLPRLAQFRGRHPEIEVRLTTSTEPVDAVSEPCDLIIRGGPDTFYGFTCHPFLIERRLPVCSPAVLERLPLNEFADLRPHTLIHASSLPRVWPIGSPPQVWRTWSPWPRSRSTTFT